MRAYRIAFAVTGAFLSVPGGILVFFGLQTPYIWHVVAAAVALVVWWGAFLYLRQAKKGSFAFAFLVSNLFLLLMLFLIAQSSMFIVRNGGFAGPEGYGGDPSFFIAVFMTLLALLPLCVLVPVGWIVLLRRKRASGVEHNAHFIDGNTPRPAMGRVGVICFGALGLVFVLLAAAVMTQIVDLVLGLELLFGFSSLAAIAFFFWVVNRFRGV